MANAETIMSLRAEKKVRIDYLMPICMVLLALMGLAFIYTSQSYNVEYLPFYKQFWMRQIVFLALGGTAYVFLARMDYEKCFIFAHAIYILSLCLLIPLVLKESFGVPMPFVQSRYNATRWINFGIFSLQPSEIAKIGTCIMVAAILARSKVGTLKQSMKVLLKLAFVISLPILLIFLQPDLGSTLVFPPMLFAMLYVSKLSKRFFIAAFIAFFVLVSILTVDIARYASFLQSTGMKASEAQSQNAFGKSHFCLPIKDYQRNRILGFVRPDIADTTGRDVNWNLTQSLISVGSGGVSGKGLGQGTQAKLGYLPSSIAYNDFVFAVLAEESGFLGAFVAISLEAVILIFCCLRAARLARDRFGQFLCVGISAMLVTHVFINIGMTLGIMPITGLPLPMLSYGGSFVLTCCILLGLVQSVYSHRQIYD